MPSFGTRPQVKYTWFMKGVLIKFNRIYFVTHRRQLTFVYLKWTCTAMLWLYPFLSIWIEYLNRHFARWRIIRIIFRASYAKHINTFWFGYLHFWRCNNNDLDYNIYVYNLWAPFVLRLLSSKCFKLYHCYYSSKNLDIAAKQYIVWYLWRVYFRSNGFVSCVGWKNADIMAEEYDKFRRKRNIKK